MFQEKERLRKEAEEKKRQEEEEARSNEKKAKEVCQYNNLVFVNKRNFKPQVLIV